MSCLMKHRYKSNFNNYNLYKCNVIQLSQELSGFLFPRNIKRQNAFVMATRFKLSMLTHLLSLQFEEEVLRAANHLENPIGM